MNSRSAKLRTVSMLPALSHLRLAALPAPARSCADWFAYKGRPAAKPKAPPPAPKGAPEPPPEAPKPPQPGKEAGAS